MSLELSGTTPAIKGVAGSVAAPAITGDDVDTGISFPSANTIKFSTGGVERIQITDAGISGTGISGGKIVGYGLATSTAVDQYGAQNSYTLVGPQLTYTGASASNKLLIHHNHHMLIEDASDWYMALWRDGLSGTKLVEKKWYSQEQMWIAATGIHVCLVDIPDTSSHTYQFATYRTSGTNRLSYNYNVGVPQIIALEIDP